MGLLDKLFGRKKEPESELPQDAIESAECPHTTLAPHWDNVDDMGKEDKIDRYKCEACQQTFSPEEGARLQAQEEQRLRRLEQERVE